MSIESQAQRRFMFALRHDPGPLGDVARGYVSGTLGSHFGGLPERMRSSPDLRGLSTTPPAPRGPSSPNLMYPNINAPVPDLSVPLTTGVLLPPSTTMDQDIQNVQDYTNALAARPPPDPRPGILMQMMKGNQP